MSDDDLDTGAPQGGIAEEASALASKVKGYPCGGAYQSRPARTAWRSR